MRCGQASEVRPGEAVPGEPGQYGVDVLGTDRPDFRR
jgi:hypothetical protein